MQEYKKYLKSLTLKDSTIKNYIWHVDKFLKWLDNQKISKSIVNEYFDYLLKKYNSVNTINLRLKIINNYLKFNNQPEHFNLLSNEDTNIQILTDSELAEFLDKASKKSNLISIRDKALLELLYYSGLKVGQIIQLKINQIDYIKKEIILNKNKALKINPSTWHYLKKYLAKRNDDAEYIFINFDRSNKSANKSLSARSVERIINKYAKGINPPININPQILRNTLAYKLKSEGAQSEHIKSALHFQTKTGAQNYLKKL